MPLRANAARSRPLFLRELRVFLSFLGIQSAARYSCAFTCSENGEKIFFYRYALPVLATSLKLSVEDARLNGVRLTRPHEKATA